MLLFPFSKGGVGCVNAIWLHSIEYSENNIFKTIDMLSLLIVVTRQDFYCKVKLEDRLCPVNKDNHFMIRSEIEVIKDDLEKKLTEVEEERVKVEMEKRVVEAEKKEMAAEKIREEKDGSKM